MTEPHSNKTPVVDPEGLRRHYSVIISGTGLVESIVAAALARTGRDVLHVDGADYYGQLDAVWTLPYVMKEQAVEPWKSNGIEDGIVLDDAVEDTPDVETLRLHPRGASQSLQIHSMERSMVWSNVAIGTVMETPYGTGVVVEPLDDRKDYATLTIQLHGDENATRLSVGLSPDWVHSNAIAPPRIHTQRVYDYHRIRTLAAATAARLLEGPEARSVALDITPLAVYAAGSAVDGLVASSVSEYVDFKSIEGLLYYDASSKQASSSLQPVPCSKNDVFASKLLSPMDKRRLMKFLQTALDFATAEALQQEEYEEEAEDEEQLLHSVNERHLNQGRSLSRPQNKAVANADLAELQALCADTTTTFHDYLRTRVASLAPLVHYALALGHDTMTTTADGMDNLCQHVRALGRFGGTAFLIPLYGSGELAQAFCRSAAVFGATYLLRRAATGIVLEQDTVKGLHIAPPTAAEDEGFGTRDESAQTTTIGPKTITCDHVVVSAGALVDTAAPTIQDETPERVFRSIRLVHGKPLGEQQQQQRHIVIFPPGSFDGQTSVIHGLLLDEYSRVVPMLGTAHACTLVHLTMTGRDADRAATIFAAAMDAITAGPTEELFALTFSYAIGTTNSTTATKGLHVMERPRPGVTADAAFAQAERIFHRICPDEKFLVVSETVGEAIREALGDAALDGEPDAEEQVLESAVGLLQPTANDASSTAATETTQEVEVSS